MTTELVKRLLKYGRSGAICLIDQMADQAQVRDDILTAARIIEQLHPAGDEQTPLLDNLKLVYSAAIRDLGEALTFAGVGLTIAQTRRVDALRERHRIKAATLSLPTFGGDRGSIGPT